MPKQYYVFVSGGLVNDVLKVDGSRADAEVEIIDFDNLEAGQCPVCMTDLVHSAPMPAICPVCGYDLKAATYLDAIKCSLGIEGVDVRAITERIE